VSCGIGRRLSLDLALLWLWRRPETIPPIRPLAWEPPCAVGAALEKAKRPKKKKKEIFRKQATVGLASLEKCISF